ncbi:MAG: amidohydrolase family protein [Halobacteriota archaeon]
MKQTLRDDVTVIDFGAHFYPPELELADRGSELREQKDRAAGKDRLHDAETVIAEMDDAGVDAMVHSITTYMGHDDAEETAGANDVLFDYVDEYDEFYGLAGIPIGDSGEAAAAEFERSVEMGMQGGGVHETDVLLTDEEMEPVLEVADRTGAPIFVHIPNLPDIDYRFNATFGRERAHQESISRVIHEEVYDRYPNLNIVWHHLGGNIASMLGRIHLHTDPGRWVQQAGMKSFTEYKADLEERVYIDTSGFFGYTAPIRIALEEFPASQVLFGTDYPWEPRSAAELDALVEAVVESGTHDDARRILGDNALDLMVNVD